MRTTYGAMAYSSSASAYSQVGIESGVMSATPHRLIVMLFDGLSVSLNSARIHMEAGNMAEKGRAISRAIDIVNQGLLAALDHEQGGELSASLAMLYNYVSGLLLRANLYNDIEKLDEATRLLGDIGSAWREIGDQ